MDDRSPAGRRIGIIRATMHESERAYVLGLLEAVLAEPPHPAEVLLTDAEGRRLPLDAWFARAQVAVSVRHEDDAELESARRDHVGGMYGMRYLVVDPRRLTRDAATDATTLRGELDLPEEGLAPASPFDHPGDVTVARHVVWVDDDDDGWEDGAPDDGWEDDGPPDGWADWDEDEEHEDDFALERDEPRAADPLEFEHGPHQLPLDHPEVRFGWRGRAIGLALLGAAATARRAFGDDRGEHRLSAGELEALAALVLGPKEDVSGEATDVRRLAIALGRSRDLVRMALHGLEHRELAARSTSTYEPETWRPTDAGREAIHAWLERVAPLVGSWPPPPAVEP